MNERAGSLAHIRHCPTTACLAALLARSVSKGVTFLCLHCHYYTNVWDNLDCTDWRQMQNELISVVLFSLFRNLVGICSQPNRIEELKRRKKKRRRATTKKKSSIQVLKLYLQWYGEIAVSEGKKPAAAAAAPPSTIMKLSNWRKKNLVSPWEMSMFVTI